MREKNAGKKRGRETTKRRGKNKEGEKGKKGRREREKRRATEKRRREEKGEKLMEKTDGKTDIGKSIWENECGKECEN